MASSVHEIDRAIANINKGSDKKDEMVIMMAPYARWDNFLAPAPMTIALLGQLTLVSAESDFSLRSKTSDTEFRRLDYPDSFRASLVQVTNKGWTAFDKAHTNMDQIRLLSGQVDGHVRNAVRFLLNRTPQEIELMLPQCLGSIEEIAEQCVVLATSVEEEFVYVMEMVGELLAVCTQKQGQYDKELKDTQINIKIAEEHKIAIENEAKEVKHRRDYTMAKMKDAENEYKEAMNDVPGTASLVGLEFADTFLGAIKKLTTMMPCLIPGMQAPNQAMQASQKGTLKHSSVHHDAARNPIEEISNVLSKTKTQVTSLLKLVFGGKENQNEPDWNAIAQKRGPLKIKKRVERLQNQMPDTVPQIQEKVDDVFMYVVDICDKLLPLARAIQRDAKEVENVTSLARKLSGEVDMIDYALQLALGENSLPSKSPHQVQQESSVKLSNDDSLVMKSLKNAHFKARTAKQNLRETRNLYEQSCEKFDKKMKQMREILASLASDKPKKLDLETIRQSLIDGIRALGELREQWGKLVKFFHMLSNLVKCSLEVSLKQFVATSSSQMKLQEIRHEMSDTMRDVLFEQAFRANQVAYVVNAISKVYVEVSDKYLLDQISGLGKLLKLNVNDEAVNDAAEIARVREELNRGCDEAQKAIVAIAKRKSQEIMQAFDKRIGRIEREVEARIPSLPAAEIKEIDEQVQNALEIRRAVRGENVPDIDDLV